MPSAQKKMKVTRLVLALATFGSIFARAVPIGISTPQKSREVTAPEPAVPADDLGLLNAPVGSVLPHDNKSTADLVFQSESLASDQRS